MVFAHGYLGFNVLGPIHYFNAIGPILQAAGFAQVVFTDVAPKGSIQDRSAELARQIKDRFGAQRVHVIAHSMGGLDARYLIAQGNANIASLSSLGTPFRGTLVADIAIDPARLEKVSAPTLIAAISRYEAQFLIESPFEFATQTHFALTELRSAVQGLAGGNYSELASYFRQLFSLEDQALSDLTTENCRRMFPEDEHDLRGLPTFSYAGVTVPSRVNPALTAAAILLDAASEQNDGLVPLASAKLKNFGGTVNTDHLGLIGWSPTDVTSMYRQIAASLSALHE